MDGWVDALSIAFSTQNTWMERKRNVELYVRNIELNV